MSIKYKKSESSSIRKAAQVIGIKSNVLEFHIDKGAIECREGRILKTECERIKKQKEEYIGLREFMHLHDSNLFKSAQSINRNKYIDFLEENNFFDIKLVYPENLIFTMPDHDDVFIRIEALPLLEDMSDKFFRDFGLTEREKAFRLIEETADKPLSMHYVRMFIDSYRDEKNIYTPALTAFVEALAKLPDLLQITDEDIISAVSSLDLEKSKGFLLDFLKYAATAENVKYHEVSLKKKDAQVLSAYPYNIFARFANILFNDEYDRENSLTEKALENSLYAEMWMYFACHYICGWRSSDICDRWIYPNIMDNDNSFGLRIETLKEDILKENIPDEIYEKITL